ncbi:hypothetical protein EDB85DRAFT_1887642 [Lactarius pseudohatsudake]|nr:hypothetical protein EDB85DRAFT_1887642 [Lactarius pseudohatsudake]
MARLMAKALARPGGDSVDEDIGESWAWRGSSRLEVRGGDGYGYDCGGGVASTWQANPRSAARRVKAVMVMARRWRDFLDWRGVEWDLKANDERKRENNDALTSQRGQFIYMRSSIRRVPSQSRTYSEKARGREGWGKRIEKWHRHGQTKGYGRDHGRAPSRI